ncbi:MAG: PBP1A family penicillin-binding protein [Parvibaculum sp.]|nr:PBP1A family penicillin-binding protein [Parvibaculum sp.]
MASRKPTTGFARRGAADDGDWTVVRVPGLRPVRLGVGANASTADDYDEDDDEDMARWEDDAFEDRGMRRLDPSFEPRKKPAPKPRKPAPKPTRPVKKSSSAKTPPKAARRKPAGKSSTARKRTPSRRGNVLGAAFYYGSVLALWGVIAFGGLLFWYGLNLPDTSGLYNVRQAPSISIRAIDGQVLSHRGDLKGGYTLLADLPAHVPAAVLATEDRRFYWHFGVDPVGLGRAMVENYRAGAYVQGGSTITQQLAKNIFLRPDRTLSRKIEEMVLAVWLELRFSKEEILTLYLNRVYFGGGAYGIEAASERYFRKPARALTLPEAAMLAGLLKAPSRYSPTNDIDLARGRAAIVLSNMVAAGYISPDEAHLANVSPASLEGYAARGSINYFVDWVAEALPNYAGRSAADVDVVTTIDPVLQREAELVIAAVLAGDGEAMNAGQAALVAMTPDGAVRAMVGGRSYALSQFNRAVQARRQPGSAFKPFVYLAAIEKGMSPDTIRVDRPVTYGGWSPSNYSDRYEGEVTLRTALAKSINTVAVQVAREVGVRNVVSAARRLGLQEELPSNLSLALGSGSATLIELTAAYATFANGGYGVIPHGISEVHAQSGEELYRRHGSGLGRVIDERTAGAMNNMLKAVMIYGTGRNAALGERPSGGKTGTSQDFRDAWFIGYTADLVVGIWVGNDNGAPMKNVTGGTLPARIWHDFMMRTQGEVPVAELPDMVVAEVPQTSVFPASAIGDGGEREYEWEEPGFFDRLFGRGEPRRPLLEPGGRR